MNIVAVFHRLVFAQVLLGIVASCMAQRAPSLLLLAGTIGAISWYVTEGPRGRAIPRWLLNAGALAAVVWLMFELSSHRADMVAAMGNFTMALQLLILYTRKTEREYSQLLVLSVLQMVGASVLSVSMIYGVFLVLYCALALATVVAFHLTAAAERIHCANLEAAQSHPAPVRPTTRMAPGSRRQLRAASAGIGLVCGIVAAAVFVTMPRTGKSAIDLGPSSGSGPSQTGFSNTVRLGTGPLGTGSREPMLNLKISIHGQPVGLENTPWLIRGAALDAYNPENHVWSRSEFANASDRAIDIEKLNQNQQIAHPKPATDYTAEIALRDSRQRAIFSVNSIPTRLGSPSFYLTRFESDSLGEVSYSPLDQQLRATESVVGATAYRVSWPSIIPGLSARRSAPAWKPRGVPPSIEELPPDQLPAPGDLPEPEPPPQGLLLGDRVEAHANNLPPVTRQDYARRWDVETQRVRAMALQIIQDAGYDRDPAARYTPDDPRIVAALVDFLRQEYLYSLDNPRPEPGEDPVIKFLFESRHGHCELFAAGLAALCRSIGIPARVVTGFRASEYNTVGGYYVVRQSNAHAWTEIDAGPGIGWRTFDATPPESVQEEHHVPDGLFASIREVYEHIEFAWIKSVVAFDSQTRQSIIENFIASFNISKHRAVEATKALTDRLAAIPKRLKMDRFEQTAAVIGIASALLVAAITLRLRIVRRRRLARLQLSSLSATQRRDLGQKLWFYLEMLDLLERRGYRRPVWQPPMDYAQELAEANPLRFGPVVSLTEHFYDVRFGHRPLDPARRQQVRAHLDQLEQSTARRDA